MSGVRAPHLQRRNGIYHLRVRVPDNVRPLLGLSEVRKSLATYSFTKARSLAAQYAAKVMDAMKLIAEKEWSGDRARTLVQQCFAGLKAEADRLDGFMPSTNRPDLEVEEQRFYGEERLYDLRRQVARSSFDPDVTLLADRLVQGELKQIPSARRIDIMSGVARALVEQQRLFLLRLEDRLALFVPVDPLFAVGNDLQSHAGDTGQMPSFVGPSVGDAISHYLEYGRKRWAAKTYAARVKQLGYLQDHLGAVTPLGAVTSHDVRAYRNAVEGLRANHGRRQAMTFAERQTESTQHRIAPKTAAVIFEPAKAFFRWCHSSEGMIDADPASGVRIDTPPCTVKEKPRRPFTADELTVLFGAPIFVGCKSRSRRYDPGCLVMRDAKYWLPILGFYTGCRLGELVQLHFGDAVLDGPIPHLSINEDNGAAGAGDRKKVKSVAAIRRVPLHPDVIKLGFAQFVKQRQAGRGKRFRLFWDFSFGSDGQASTLASKFFGRFMNAAGLTDPALVFHSFRHCAEDAFRNAQMQEYVIDRIIGHADQKTSSAYGEGIDLETAYEAVKAMKLKICLPDFWNLHTDQ
jgi:integrase